MERNPDLVLKYSAAAGIIIASLSVAYYFVIFVPHKERMQIEMQQKQQQEQQIKEDAAASAAAKETAVRQVMLDSCLYQADESYVSAWAVACKGQLDAAITGLNTCPADTTYCHNLWDSMIEKSKGSKCTLAGARADDVNRQHKEMKDDCYKRYGN